MIERYDWASMQDAMYNCVVQVIAQVTKFNWQEPYKVTKQFEGRGSGFFIDNEGHVVTNAHVVDEASTVWIHISSFGKKNFLVDIVGFCPERDLALLRIRKEGLEFLKKHIGVLSPLPLGDSDLVRRTDQVLVLGYPLGNYTMKSSTGVVSGRESYGSYSLIQITAPVNPGNSGGPLINALGQVIGITIATIAGAQNIGFAIPINEMKIIIDDLYKQPLVRRGSLGIQFNFASDDHAQLLNNPIPAGMYICKVMKNSLLEKMGIQEGDMLYEFNGFRIDAFGDATVPWSRDKVSFNDLVSRLKQHEQFSIVVYRQGQRIEKTATFEITPPYPIRRMYPNYETIDYEIIAGLVVMQLADNHLPVLAMDAPYLITYTKIEAKMSPVLVITHILSGSLAQLQRNLFPGSIIATVNGQAVNTIDEFRKALTASVESDLLTIKTTDDILAVFPFKRALKEEAQLSKEFSYPLSKTMQDLRTTLSL